LAGIIQERVDRMFAEGLEAEVRDLMDRFDGSAPAWKATGYSTVRDLVEGKIDSAPAVRLIEIATRQYAKRQRTWFRHQLPADAVTRIDPLAPDAVDRARAWWEGRITQ